MTKAQETLKTDIEKINDDLVIEKVNIFILDILAQESIEKQKCKTEQYGGQNQNDYTYYQ